jgi:hypothetical protein
MIKIVSSFFTSRGVRQGDHISLIFLNFMADVFTKMLVKAAASRQLAGLMQKLGNGGGCNMLLTSCYS